MRPTESAGPVIELATRGEPDSQAAVVRKDEQSGEVEAAGPITVYTSASPLSQPLKLAAAILGDIWRHRELTWILFQRDLKGQFRQSFLGYFWLVIPPLATAFVWYLLNAQKMINAPTGDVPYPAFVLIGSTLWAAFSATVMSPGDTLLENRDVVVKLNVPLESFVLASTGKAVFSLAITCAVTLPILLLQGVTFHWTAVLFPLAALLFLTLGFAVGMCLAPIGALYTDLRSAITPLLALLMFTAPVVFPMPNNAGTMAAVMRYNPLTPALALSRDSLVTGNLEWLSLALCWFAVGLVLLMATFVATRVAKPHIIARMGT